MMESQSGGIVYVLTNPAMPGIVKVGKTARENIETRLNELYSTGVPVPFECEYAARVEDETDVEKAFHIAFSPYRINPKREFFQIEAEQAVALLKVMAIEDVTPSLQAEAEKVDADAREGARRLKTRRPNLNFVEMGIPIGSELLFHQDGKTVEVVSEKKVQYDGKEFSLTAISTELAGLGRRVSPGPLWYYKGKTINQIYDETYGAA